MVCERKRDENFVKNQEVHGNVWSTAQGFQDFIQMLSLDETMDLLALEQCSGHW